MAADKRSSDPETMHFYALIPFALILWWPEERPFPYLLAVQGPGMTLLVVLGQIGLLTLIGLGFSYIGIRNNGKDAFPFGRAQAAHHAAVLTMRVGAVLTFAVDLFVTQWPEWVRSLAIPDGWSLDELAILLPFFVTVLFGLTATYPLDARLRKSLARQRVWDGSRGVPQWTLGTYLNFHLRHQLLVVAVPMILITVVYDLTRSSPPWISYSAMTAAGATIFLVAPLLLRFIWSTEALPAGALRLRLERLSGRIGLRFREILIWRSEGMMVNAAVMGLVPQVRYVLLSDGLLESMTDEQIEAVFGHEAGHIRHHHITFFVLFAILGTMLISGVMELLLRLSERGALQLSMDEISVIGFFCMIFIWGFGFGWVSRRFEAQADLYGAQCASPLPSETCPRPCSVHREEILPSPPGRGAWGEGRTPDEFRTANSKGVVRKSHQDVLCSTGAEIFRSALEKVAILNGIPLRERSWRHGSIAYRLHALARLAGDPSQTQRFNRLVRRMKTTLLIGCGLGLVVLIAYVTWHPAYRTELQKPLEWLHSQVRSTPWNSDK